MMGQRTIGPECVSQIQEVPGLWISWFAYEKCAGRSGMTFQSVANPAGDSPSSDCKAQMWKDQKHKA
jgi:hypothetical protein